MALAPSFPLFGVPSAAIRARSSPTWSVASRPTATFASASLTLATALVTPLPPYRFLSPSRSSTASWIPVLAPEGTAARPSVPSARITSTSTVGLPRESRISRPRTWAIIATGLLIAVVWLQSPGVTLRSPHGPAPRPARLRVRAHFTVALPRRAILILPARPTRESGAGRASRGSSRAPGRRRLEPVHHPTTAADGQVR